MNIKKNNYFKTMDECQHDFLDNVCQKCNLILENYFDKKYQNISHVKDTNKYNLIDQIEGIPPKIISIAKKNIIRKQNETGKKVRNDKKQTFIQLYEAIIESGINFDPTVITRQLGLGKKEINWCIKEVSQTSLVPSVHEEASQPIYIVIVSPLVYIEDICKNINLESEVKKLKEITEKIMDKKDILYSFKPNYIACGIVKSFCVKNNIQIKGFSRKNNISDNALNKAVINVEEFFQ